MVTDAFTEHPALDIAVSRATLESVADGSIGDIFRIHVPAPTVAFGGADRSHPGYPEAVRAAEAHGFAAVERLAGGRAAVFHESTLAFAWATAENDPREGITSRFRLIANVMVSAFEALGIDARIGQVPGEYCPGEWSVNVAGRAKVMGVGQRLIRGAAHVGGVVVVDQGRRVRDVLIPVHRALDIDWDPRTSGSLSDRAPGLDNHKVTGAIIGALSQRLELTPGHLPEPILESARHRVPDYLPRVA